MNKYRKALVFFFIVFLLLIPLNIISQSNVDAAEVNKEIRSSVKFGTTPKVADSKSLSVSSSGLPLISNGQNIDTLYDSYWSYQNFTFSNITSYSSEVMSVNIEYYSENFYVKDSIVTMEFYKDTNGYLEYQGYTDFNTYEKNHLNLISNINKSTFSDENYIYIKIGISEYIDDAYSDYTYFKIINPYYSSDKTPPAKPTVNTVGDNATTVTGKAESYSTVYVKLGSTMLGHATAKSDGSFTVSIPKQKAGTKLTVYAQDAAGNKSSVVYITVVDKTAPAKPGITFIGDNQTIIVGTAEAGSTVTLKLGTTVLSQKTTNNYGYFTMTISKQKAGSTLYIYAKDKAGNQSAGTSVKVIDVTPPKTPTVNKVTYTSTSISGVTDAAATVYAYYGTTLLGKSTATSTGNYKITIPVQKKGATLKVYTRDSSGNQSNTTSVVVY